MKTTNGKYRAKKKQMIASALGVECYFCHRTENQRIHNKWGMRHLELADMNLSNLKNALASDDFIILCARCHGCVHWCMKYLKMSWVDIIE